MTAPPIIDSAFLERLERLALRWQRSFTGLVGGHNSSRLPGAGQDFLDHRNFQHGDDLRAVNWRAYMRLEKLFLKMFQVEPRIPVRLLIDTSASMLTGERRRFDYSLRLAAALCYIGLVKLDSICMQPFGAGLHEPCVCSGGRHRFVNAARFLSEIPTGGRTCFLEIARQFIDRYPQPGMALTVPISSTWRSERALQYLADFGHELLLIHVWDENDRTPPWNGWLELTDAETGQRLDLAFDDRARQEYAAEFDSWSRQLRTTALRNNGRYVGLSTSVPVEEAIFGPLIASGGIQ